MFRYGIEEESFASSFFRLFARLFQLLPLRKYLRVPDLSETPGFICLCEVRKIGPKNAFERRCCSLQKKNANINKEHSDTSEFREFAFDVWISVRDDYEVAANEYILN